MDFFREQDVARRNTRLLTILFVVAVLVLIGITNVLFVGLILVESGEAGTANLTTDLVSWQQFFAVGGVITLVIGAVVLVNWINLARGGSQIAAALGGRLVQPGSDDPLERRAANIVQEMALAATAAVLPALMNWRRLGVSFFMSRPKLCAGLRRLAIGDCGM